MRRSEQEHCEELSQRFLGVPLRIDHQVWVLREFRSVVGFCSAGICDSGHAIFLSASAISPGARGLGHQARAIRLREKAGRRLGVRSAITYTSPESIASMRNLIRCGYNLYEPAKQWAGKGPWLYWIKRL